MGHFPIKTLSDRDGKIVGEDSGADKSLSQSSSSNSLWPKYYKIKQEELKEMVKLLGVVKDFVEKAKEVEK